MHLSRTRSEPAPALKPLLGTLLALGGPSSLQPAPQSDRGLEDVDLPNCSATSAVQLHGLCLSSFCVRGVMPVPVLLIPSSPLLFQGSLSTPSQFLCPRSLLISSQLLVFCCWSDRFLLVVSCRWSGRLQLLVSCWRSDRHLLPVGHSDFLSVLLQAPRGVLPLMPACRGVPLRQRPPEGFCSSVLPSGHPPEQLRPSGHPHARPPEVLTVCPAPMQPA